MINDTQYFRTKRGLIAVEFRDGKPVTVTFAERSTTISADSIRRIGSIDAGDECASVAGMKYLALDYVDAANEPRVVRTMMTEEAFNEFSRAMLSVF
jgi:hypothetical protein